MPVRDLWMKLSSYWLASETQAAGGPQTTAIGFVLTFR
jgi:hypothetical protein